LKKSADHSVSEIISLLRQRDEKGLAMLYDNYSAALNGIALRIVGSSMIADDILQETFLKIWNNFDQYDENKAALFTWMARIARNSAIDTRRLKSFEHNRKTDSLDSTVHIGESTNISTAEIDVNKLLEGMDSEHKKVLDLVYLQGYSHSQASEQLQIPLGTVKTRIRSSISTLREKIKQDKKLFFGLLLILLMLIVHAL